jgi:hypothetical protein
MYPIAPEPIFEFFYTERTRTEVPFVVFSGSLLEVGGSWLL